jgi:hypothetical protein
MEELKAGCKKFMHEFTRQLLIAWADQSFRGEALRVQSGYQAYLEHAVAQNWVSKDRTRVLEAGYAAAAGQLKR